MKRVHFFEFEDLRWFPNDIRMGILGLLTVLDKLLKIDKTIAGQIAPLLQKHKLNQIVDLGSGAGGAMPSVQQVLATEYNLSDIKVLLTDLYPNQQAINRINQKENETLRYHELSVDATNLKTTPNGLRTMINCFHHMPPPIARGILKSAQDSRQPIFIYELAENKIPFLLWLFLLPLSLLIVAVMALLMTPMVRPFTFKTLLYTIIPIVPLCYAWDGQVSMVRMYTMSDIDELLDGLHEDGYSWDRGLIKDEKGKVKGTYIVGEPA